MVWTIFSYAISTLALISSPSTPISWFSIRLTYVGKYFTKETTPCRFLLVSLLFKTAWICSLFEVVSSNREEFTRKNWTLTTCLSNSPFRRVCCLSNTPCKNTLPRSSASARNRSKHAVIPTICLKRCVSANQKRNNYHSITYMLSISKALSIQVLSSVGRKPKIRSMAPRTSFTVDCFRPADRAACRRK